MADTHLPGTLGRRLPVGEAMQRELLIGLMQLRIGRRRRGRRWLRQAAARRGLL